MRRLSILLLFALTFASFAIAPASAKRPRPPATTPDCTVELLTGITGSGGVGVECLWTPEEAETLVGTVSVDPSSAISGLVVFVRDSAPGDICVLEQPGKVDSLFVADFDLVYPVLPDGFVPPFEPYNYEPYEDETYWTWNAPNWCYPQDTFAGQHEDLNGKPLVVNVGWISKKNTTVDVTLYPAQEG